MGTRPKDFLTLVRLTVMTKLSRDAHLHVRSFLSEDGKYINVVLKADRKAVEECLNIIM
jgi:anoctamin-10